MPQPAEQPLVTVIITVFRRTTYIAQAVASACAQTHANLEVIVSEDGLSNVAEPLVLEMARSDPRIRYRRNETNLGEAGNRVAAYRDARGQFLVNLDDDDLLEPTFVAELLAPLLADPSLALAFCDHHVINADAQLDPQETETNTRRWKRDTLAPGVHSPFWKIGLIDGSIPMSVGALFRKSAFDIERFPVSVGSTDDLFIVYLLGKSGGGAFYVPKRLSRYRLHPTQETNVGGLRIARGTKFCLTQFLQDSQLKPLHAQFKQQYRDTATGVGIELLRVGVPDRARAEFAESLGYGLSLRALAGYVLSFLPRAVVHRFVRKRPNLTASTGVAIPSPDGGHA